MDLGHISEVMMPILKKKKKGLLGDCIQNPIKTDIYNYHVYQPTIVELQPILFIGSTQEGKDLVVNPS